MKLIQWGNKKLGDMLMFNIPASKEICGRLCKDCYSYKAYKIYPNVLPAQTARYEASKQDDFVARVNKQLKAVKKPFKFLRIHGSAGEFYSQKYINKWVSIVKSNPNITFYTYTKRLEHFDFSELKSLDNMVLIDSLHFKVLNYGPIDKAPVGAFVCPDHTKETKCGETCMYCMGKTAQSEGVFFVQH